MVIAWGSSIIKTAEVLKKTIVSGPHRLLRSEYKSIKELCMHSIPQPLTSESSRIALRRLMSAAAIRNAASLPNLPFHSFKMRLRRSRSSRRARCQPHRKRLSAPAISAGSGLDAIANSPIRSSSSACSAHTSLVLIARCSTARLVLFVERMLRSMRGSGACSASSAPAPFASACLLTSSLRQASTLKGWDSPRMSWR